MVFQEMVKCFLAALPVRMGKIRSAVAQKERRSKEGTYAVLGNHDLTTSNSIFQKFVADSHIQLLDNQAARLSCLNLVGRTNAAHNHRDPVEYFTGKVDRTVPTVVVDRDPNSIPEALSFGASLVLCGHTHKGQFFPATFFTCLANGNHFFSGCEKFGDAYAVISSGAGYFQLPVRIGTDSEVVEIRLS